MKKSIFGISLIIGLWACTDHTNQIGQAVDAQNAVSVALGLKNFQEGDTNMVTIFGKVNSVCQSEGCWFAYDFGDSGIIVNLVNDVHVPKSIQKKDLYAVGHFHKETKQIDSAHTIDTYNFEATGVKFK